jgi:hypothetical protein
MVGANPAVSRLSQRRIARRATRKGVKSVETGLALLVALAEAPSLLSLKALSATAQLPPGKAHRYLATFARAGLITQDAQSGLYDLGPLALRLRSRRRGHAHQHEIHRAGREVACASPGGGAHDFQGARMGMIRLDIETETGRLELPFRPAPAGADGAALVLLPAIAGVNDYVHQAARRLHERGYGVLGDAARAFEKLRRTDGIDPQRIGALGFCIGGMYAQLGACEDWAPAAAVNYYGTVRYASLTPEKPNSPQSRVAELRALLLAHYGIFDRPAVPHGGRQPAPSGLRATTMTPKDPKPH